MNPLHAPTAFPSIGHVGQPISGGMSLWAYFAAAALNGVCANNPKDLQSYEHAATLAADMADAMMREHNARIGVASSNDGAPK